MTASHRQRQLLTKQNKEEPAVVVPLKSQRRTIRENGSDGGDDHTAVVVKRPPSNLHSSWVLSVAAVAVAIGAIAFLSFLDQSSVVVSTAQQSHSMANDTNGTVIHDETSAFMAWFQLHGGRVSDKISIAQFDDMGRGIVARMPIDEHDELLFVPLDLIICRDTILKFAPQKLVAKYEKLRDVPTELLTAFLLLEQFKDAKGSRWSPYLRLLPQYPIDASSVVATPLFYASDAMLDELQDERMIQVATLERRQAKTAFLRFRRLFKSVLPVDAKVSALLEKRYLWARFLINSRAFSIRGDRFLVPFGDVFNGKPQPNDHDRADGNGARFLDYHRLQKGRAGMEILADRAVLEAGQQVLEDYGDNDNYIYFLYHGFLMDANPFDCAAARLPSMNHRPIVTRILDPHAYGGGGDNRLVCITPQGTLLSPQDTQAVQFQASVSAMDDAYADALCSPRENHALCERHATRAEQDELLVAAIRHQLDQFKTTTEDDIAFLSEATTAPSLRHAIQFRVSRKQILKSALLTLETNLNRPDVNYIEEDHQPEIATHMERPLDEKMQIFSEWVARQQFLINHVELKYVSPRMGYGTFATTTLQKGDVYLSVPADIVMDIRSALRSSFIRNLIVQSPQVSVRWTESHLLLLHLLHEKFAPAHWSRWRPYLDILPDQARLASPLFFVHDGPEIQHLHEAVPDDLSHLVREYRRRADADFALLQRALPHWISLERFRWANAILDSRSIWWSGSRHLVPLLDMVNCLELSRDHAPHATRLEGEGDVAITRASWVFEKGNHVVENYAQANYIYLLYHGFVLGENTHDCAHVHFELDVARQLDRDDTNRHVVIGIMEKMQLNSWSQDVCVGGQNSAAGSSLDQLMRLALIAESPQKAADAERRSSGQITKDHIEAATRATQQRLARLAAAIAKHTTSASTEAPLQPILTYVEQQHRLMTQVLVQLSKQQP